MIILENLWNLYSAYIFWIFLTFKYTIKKASLSYIHLKLILKKIKNVIM